VRRTPPSNGTCSKPYPFPLFVSDTLPGAVSSDVGGAVSAVGGCSIGRSVARVTTAIRWVSLRFDPPYKLGYDNADDLALAQDNNSEYNYTHNAGGQKTGETVTYPGYSSSPLVSLDFTYDQFGNRTGMTDSLGGSMGYTYNGENQMTGMSLALNGTTAASLTMNCDGLARLSGTTMSTPTGATIASANSYDNASRLTNISYTNGGSTLASYNYTYNAASEITNYQDNSGNTLTYGYDYSGELTSASGTLTASDLRLHRVRKVYRPGSEGRRGRWPWMPLASARATEKEKECRDPITAGVKRASLSYSSRVPFSERYLPRTGQFELRE
jgi:YD repeat-containing protein